MEPRPTVAYFTMEIAVDPRLPTYSGGLGVLAGDAVRSAADLRVPMVTVTLLHRRGYFVQHLDELGRQTETPARWDVEGFLEELPARVTLTIHGRSVAVRAWRREVEGVGGARVPVLFLDTDLPENAPQDRELTHYLYGGDRRYRLCQEVVLGVGGVRLLQALGYHDITRYHMNEGHAALLAAELLRQTMSMRGETRVTDDAIAAVRRKCVFTTHTPVPAGHDVFPLDLAKEVLGRHDALEVSGLFTHDGLLNMTYAALNLSHYVNGVAKRHGEVSRKMFGSESVDSVTNGVHLATWAAPAFHALFDRYIEGWKADNASLRFAVHIPPDEIRAAHQQCKRELFDNIKSRTGVALDAGTLTIGYGRRATAYKRPTLLMDDPARLRRIAERVGKFQVVYAGKAHPNDQAGKELVRDLFRSIGTLRDAVQVVYLPNYDMGLGQLMTAGCDLWLNTPEPPMEASGTSGMKAAVNGVPSLSVLDGWWVEGCIEDVTGWSIGEPGRDHDRPRDAEALYSKLEQTIVPMYYRDPARYLRVMQGAIVLNASFFNTERMMHQYITKAYFS
ncbi:MAG: alpha-glucan family phosphorylase [Phycisphaerales bacterium]|nr:alpha-glucan family phosphorylase [Phycisphaerales bacterium]